MSALRQDSDDEFTLVGNEGVWITVGPYSVRIRKTVDGMVCGVYPKGKENEGPIADNLFFDADLKE